MLRTEDRIKPISFTAAARRTQRLEKLRIIYRDEHLVAMDKPPGLLVHRTAIAQAEDFALQRLRAQVGSRVYTIHRLDRPTSGVLVFGLSREAAVAVARQFAERRVTKHYLAVVRGWPDADGMIDYPLSDAPELPVRSAITRYHVLARAELPVAVGRYATSRYALVKAAPLTGRFHQIRRHFHHIYHPLIGDTTHGEGRHNRFFRERLGVGRLLLHAVSLAFVHPETRENLCLRAPTDGQWDNLMTNLGWAGSMGSRPTGG